MNTNTKFIHCLIYSGLFFLISSLNANNYWQQHVAYEIHVTLNDSAHTLSAQEKLVYTNHSPDTLTFIWFHLWPNAYKNNETAFAKQKLEQNSTRFYYAKEKDRGFIDSLNFMVNGKSLDWEYHPEWIDVALVHLSKPLAPGEQITIETPFFVKLPIVFSRLGHSGKHYEISQWYPKPAVYDREGWHPIPYLDQGEFYSEFGTFDVYITLPKDYRVMATGDLVNGEAEYAWLDSLAVEGETLHSLDKKAFKKKIKRLTKAWRKAKKAESRKKKSKIQKEKDKKLKTKLKILHFHQEKVHDFAWFADPYWIVRKGELWLPAHPAERGSGGADSTRKVTLWSMYLPKNAKLWEKSIEYVHDAGYWYSRFYGAYPYNHITAVNGDMSAGGGMEYPNITVISSGGSKDLLEFVIMHEVGHNWFYGILGSNERDHAWMDEGLNEYTNIRYWEKKYPERNGAITIVDFVQNKLNIAKNLDFRWLMGYLGYQQRAVTLDDQPIDLTSAEFHQANYSSIVYGKTAIFMRFLQHYLGEEKINEIMQDFYETWKFKHPSPEDFKSFFGKHLDEDLSWFFDDVINGTKVIDYAVHSIKNGTVVVTNLGTMNPPVELAFYGKHNSEIGRQWLPGFEGERSLDVPEGTNYVVIDPGNYMPDINRENNTTFRSTKVNFVFDQPTFLNREINLLPWLGWNVYNGTTPGIVGYSGFIPGYRYGITVSPQWDFKHDKLVGGISARKTFFQLFGFRKLVVSLAIGDFSGRRGSKISFSGMIRKPIVSTPSVTISGAFFTHDIDSTAVNPEYYEYGKFSLISSQAIYSYKPNPFLSYSGKVRLLAGVKRTSFFKPSLEGNLKWEYHRRFILNIRTWIGTIVAKNHVPNQYKIWLGGGVDSNFENRFVFNRMTDTGEEHAFKNMINIYDEQYIKEGPGLRGAVPVASSETAWGLNVDETLPFGSLSLFGDMGGLSDSGKVYIDAGVKFSLMIVNFYFPLYQSWDKDPVIHNFKLLKSRARFEFNLHFNI